MSTQRQVKAPPTPQQQMFQTIGNMAVAYKLPNPVEIFKGAKAGKKVAIKSLKSLGVLKSSAKNAATATKAGAKAGSTASKSVAKAGATGGLSVAFDIASATLDFVDPYGYNQMMTKDGLKSIFNMNDTANNKDIDEICKDNTKICNYYKNPRIADAFDEEKTQEQCIDYMIPLFEPTDKCESNYKDAFRKYMDDNKIDKTTTDLPLTKIIQPNPMANMAIIATILLLIVIIWCCAYFMIFLAIF